MSKWKSVVKATLENYPETRENNQALWVRISETICEMNGWNTLDEVILHTLNETLPNQHSLVAAASVVKREYPELMPGPVSHQRKEEIRGQYIEEWNNKVR